MKTLNIFNATAETIKTVTSIAVGKECLVAVNEGLREALPDTAAGRMLASLIGDPTIDPLIAVAFRGMVAAGDAESPTMQFTSQAALDAAFVTLSESTLGQAWAKATAAKAPKQEANNAVPEKGTTERAIKIHGTPAAQKAAAKDEPKAEPEKDEVDPTTLSTNCRVCGEKKSKNQLKQKYQMGAKFRGLIPEYDEYHNKKRVCSACIKTIKADLKEALKDDVATKAAEAADAEADKLASEKVQREIEHWETKIATYTETYNKVKTDLGKMLEPGKTLADVPEDHQPDGSGTRDSKGKIVPTKGKPFPSNNDPIWVELFGTTFATMGYESAKSLNLYAASIKDAEDTLVDLKAGGVKEKARQDAVVQGDVTPTGDATVVTQSEANNKLISGANRLKK